MAVQTQTLAEFLLARIAEDEAEFGALASGVRDESAGPNGVGWAEVGAINEVLMVSHARMRAECEAKRRIVELHEIEAPYWLQRRNTQDHWIGGQCSRCTAGGEYPYAPGPDGTHQPCATLRALAAPYSDHPDYDQAWRP